MTQNVIKQCRLGFLSDKLWLVSITSGQLSHEPVELNQWEDSKALCYESKVGSY